MKLKTIAAAAVVALTSLSSHAASQAWGQHALLESAAGLSQGGLIFDTYSFDLGGSSTVASSVSALGSIVPASYSLFAVGGDGLVGTSDDTGLASWTFGGTPTVNSLVLGAGSYYYSVFGFANGTAAYSLNSAASATTVPEPETYALLAAGLGAIGFVIARRGRDR